MKVLVYGAIAAFTILLAYKAFVFFLAWFLFLAFMGVPTLTFLIPDKFKTPEQICHEKEYKRGMDEYSNYVRKQQEEEEQRRRWDEAEERLNHHHYTKNLLAQACELNRIEIA